MQSHDPTRLENTSFSLLRRVCSSDQAAWQRLCELYLPLIYGQCRTAGIQEEDSQDIAQEVLLSVQRRVDEFRQSKETASFRSWLHTITRHKIIDFVRVQARGRGAAGGTDNLRRIDQLPDEPPSESSANHHGVDPAFMRALELKRKEYDERTWNIFWRFTIDGVPAKEVAEEYGTTAGNVRQIKIRVLRQLRMEFEGLVEFPE